MTCKEYGALINQLTTAANAIKVIIDFEGPAGTTEEILKKQMADLEKSIELLSDVNNVKIK